MYFEGYLSYLIYMLPALLFTLAAQMMVKSSFSKYSKVMMSGGLTGHDIARRILNDHGLAHVRIECVGGDLTDHYDPKTDTVRLSASTYDSHSVAAAGIAAHEVGHAVQHAEGYGPIKLREAIIPVCNISSSVAPFLLILGLILSIPQIFYLGIIAFSAAALFQLITLPVEFNASRRALETLDNGVLGRDELSGARKVLRAAAMTYVAALLTSLLQILYYLSRFRGNRR